MAWRDSRGGGAPLATLAAAILACALVVGCGGADIPPPSADEIEDVGSRLARIRGLDELLLLALLDADQHYDVRDAPPE